MKNEKIPTKFGDITNETLRNTCKLPEAVVRELEKAVFREFFTIIDQRKRNSLLTAKQIRATLSSLLKDTKSLKENLNQSKKHLTTEMLFQIYGPKYKLLKELENLEQILEEIEPPKSESGNKTLDTLPIVTAIAEILLKNEIKTQRTGSNFRRIVETVFDSLFPTRNKSVNHAIKQAWPEIEEMINNPYYLPGKRIKTKALSRLSNTAKDLPPKSSGTFS